MHPNSTKDSPDQKVAETIQMGLILLPGCTQLEKKNVMARPKLAPTHEMARP
jgi:hypothetical protein